MQQQEKTAGIVAQAANEIKEAEAEEGPHGESTIAVIAAILANIAVGVVKFIASAISGSSAMFSEGIHSIVDSGNGLLVLLGIHQAKKPADSEHPFGRGKELYFWTMLVAILIFAMGGGVSIWEGVQALKAVGPDTKLGDPTMAYIVLVLAMIIEGVSLTVALKQFNLALGDTPPIQFIKEAKDPSLYTVVLEDTAAETGLIIAFLGLFFGHLFNNPYLDGIAAILIGLLLATVATILLRETKGLLIGEGMNHDELEEIQQMVEADEAVARCGRILTLYMGPTELVVTIDAGFKPSLTAGEVLAAVDRIEDRIRTRFPQATRVFIEAESLRQVQIQHDAFEALEDEEELTEEEIEAAEEQFLGDGA